MRKILVYEPNVSPGGKLTKEFRSMGMAGYAYLTRGTNNETRLHWLSDERLWIAFKSEVWHKLRLLGIW